MAPTAATGADVLGEDVLGEDVLVAYALFAFELRATAWATRLDSLSSRPCEIPRAFVERTAV